MKEDDKQRNVHHALLQMLYPPPSPPPQEDEEEQKNSIDALNCLPVEELEGEEEQPSPSPLSIGGDEKLTRAQRKRHRKKKLREAAALRRKIIGPLLPGSSEVGENDGEIDGVGRSGAESVGRNAGEGSNAALDVSGETANRHPLQNKVTQRRKSKKLDAKRVSTSSIEGCTGGQSQGHTIAPEDENNS